MVDNVNAEYLLPVVQMLMPDDVSDRKYHVITVLQVEAQSEEDAYKRVESLRFPIDAEGRVRIFKVVRANLDYV